MGLLKKGEVEPNRWDASEKFRKIREYVKKHGIIQFINIYNAHKDRVDNDFRWGDELEYLIVDTSEKGKVRLVLKPLEYIESIASGHSEPTGEEEKSSDSQGESSDEKSDDMRREPTSDSQESGETDPTTVTDGKQPPTKVSAPIPQDKTPQSGAELVVQEEASLPTTAETMPDPPVQVLKMPLKAAASMIVTPSAESADDMNELIVHPEFASYMVELIPRNPHDDTTLGLLNLQQSMVTRRRVFEKHMAPGEVLVSMANFPRLGARGEFTTGEASPGGNAMESAYMNDDVISDHPRFATLARNIRLRRGKKVDIQVPLFIDTNTVDNSKVARTSLSGPVQELQSESSKDKADKPTIVDDNEPDMMFRTEPAPPDILAFPGNMLGLHDAGIRTSTIHMDAMVFGMGMCCQQVTFLARTMDEGRDMYDQLLVVTPIMLALSANTPFFKSLVSDWDVRWNVISMSVDGRTDEERGHVASKGPSKWGLKKKILKSRYSGCSTFLSRKQQNKPGYSDLPLNLDESAYKTLVDAGVDTTLATHFAHLWIRDPLVIYEDKLEIDDKTSTDHFENIQSTNWGSMRFKVPVPEKGIGWRVEFRPMDLQLTEFENAAYAIFTVLLSRAFLHFGTDLYIPISQIDVNMQRAHNNNAVRTEQMYFRNTSDLKGGSSQDGRIREQSIEEIMCGPDGTSGLIGLVYDYLKDINCDEATVSGLSRYIDLIKNRATGKLLTGAQWQREFVYKNSLYKQDSVLSEALVRELVDEWQAVACQGKEAPSLLPKDFFTCPDTSLTKAFKLEI